MANNYGTALRFACLLTLCLSSLVQPGATLASERSFRSLEGAPVSLEHYRGQVVVLNVWAIWCGPCIGEIPELVELQRRIGPNEATVIGLAVDSGSAKQVLGFWRRRLDLEPSYPLWLSSMQEAEEYLDVQTVPLTLLIDREGKIRERLLGAHDAETFMEKLEPLL